MKSTSRLKRAIKAGKQAMAGQHYGLKNKPFHCPFCGHDRFKASLYIPILMMHPLICSECSHVQLFEKMPEAIDEQPRTRAMHRMTASRRQQDVSGGGKIMICLTWNLEWRLPSSAAGRLIRAEIARHDPDVLCVTEAVVSMLPEGHIIESDPNYGYAHDGSRRKAILWSKSRWEDIDTSGDEAMPPGRFVSGITQGVRFIGVCIPWRDAHVKTGMKDKNHWEDHLSYCTALSRVLARHSRDVTPICVMGDFNQRIPQAGQPAHVFNALMQVIPSSFHIITAGTKDSDGKQIIDHIAISGDLESEKIIIVPRYSADGTRLSDHVGVATTIKNKLVPAAASP
jgi:hypothetical protein